MRSTFLLDSILVTAASRRVANTQQTIDSVISDLCREFLKLQSRRVELVFDEKLGIKTLPPGTGTALHTLESIQQIIEQMDHLDALRCCHFFPDVQVDLVLDDDLIDLVRPFQSEFGGSLDAAISEMANAMLSTEEQIEAYELELDKRSAASPRPLTT